MSKLKFLTSAFGTSSQLPVNQAIKYYSVTTGAYAGNIDSSVSLAAHTRTGKSSNPSLFIPGTATKWRDPSSYSRSQWEFENFETGDFYTGPGKNWLVKGSPIRYSNMYDQTNSSTLSKNPWFSAANATPNKSYSEYANGIRTCQTKALADLASSKANIGENLATLGQTANMFATVGKDTVNILRALWGVKNGNFRKIANLNVKSLKRLVKSGEIDKRVANYWLMYWYGFKPLVSDAIGIYELLQEQSKPALLVHGRGRSIGTHSSSFKGSNPSTIEPPLSVTDHSNIKFQCQLTGRVTHDLIRQLNRVSLLNVPSLAWELVPFSFVVDWAIPVGTTLSALTATSGLTFQGGVTTVTHDREVWSTVYPTHKVKGEPRAAIRTFGFERTKLSSFPYPQLYSRDLFDGASRFATAAALIRNLASKITG